MKAVHIVSIGKLGCLNVPMPELQAKDDVLIRVRAVGVCGSDVHYYETGRIGTQVVEFPYRVGHECAGEVAAVAPGVTRVKPGDRVSVDPAGPCHTCDQCRKGRENTCRNMRFLGVPGEGLGCMAEYIVMPETSLYPIPETMSMETAALCEPFSIGLYAVHRAQLPPKARVAIQGAGPIGLSIMTAARCAGAERIYVTDKIPARLDVAKINGADWIGNPSRERIVDAVHELEPDGLDAVFECAGQQETIEEALSLLTPGGKFVFVGIPRLDTLSFDMHRFRRKEIDIINIRRQNNMHGRAVEMLGQGIANADFMITHRFTLAQSAEAFETVANYADGVVKAMVAV